MGLGALNLMFWLQSVSSHADGSDIYTSTAYLFECFNYELTYLDIIGLEQLLVYSLNTVCLFCQKNLGTHLI